MGPKEPKLGTKPRDVVMSSDENVNEMIHSFTEQFAKGMGDEDEENLHDLDDSVPLEKKDDHLND